MLTLDIKGKAKSICRAELAFAAAFFARYLMGDRLVKNLDIQITMSKMKGNVQGYAHPCEFDMSPRSFEIEINRGMSKENILQCLAHEMVHVKQYARNELKDELIMAKWQGKTYKITNSFEDYLNYPWEVEAYGRDRALHLFYRMHLKEEKITFKRGRMYVNGKLFRKA